MSWLGEQMDDLKYYCSKDNTDKKLRSTYRQLAVLWILTIVFTIVVPCLWVVPMILGSNTAGSFGIVRIIITIIYAIMVIFSIFAFISATKE